MCKSHAEPRFAALSAEAPFRHSFLLCGTLMLPLCLLIVSYSGSSRAQTPAPDTCPLHVSAAPGAPEDTVLSPPAGEYQLPCGDIALVRAGRSAAPASLPEWSGEAAGAAHTLAVPMNGPRRLAASFPDRAVPSAFPDSIAAPDQGALHAFLGSGGLYGWFTVNRRKDNTGAGIAQLVSADEPFCPVFNRPNLNFEHIMNGCRDDQWRAEDTPRTDPMQVSLLSPSCVEIRWPAETSTWKLDCVMRYAFTGNNAVDMEFEVTPRAEEAPRGFLLFMWASYLHMARERTIHFPGVRDGAQGWVAFGREGESGTVAGEGQPPLAWDIDSGVMNLNPAEGVRFREPVYYGLVDGDQNMDTTDDVMAYVMMFDEPESTRFAVWNWGDSPWCSAWDWQFVVRDPEVGRSYRQHARMVCKRFKGEDDVLVEYRRWAAGRAAAAAEAPLPLAAFPLFLSPGQDKQDPIQLGDTLRDGDPDRALRLYREALRADVSRSLAVNRINETFQDRGDGAGRRSFWSSVAMDGPAKDLARYQLGWALEQEGRAEQAAPEYVEALRLNPGLQEARLRLGGLTAAGGALDQGLRMIDEAVAALPDLSGPASEVCDTAARARSRAGDAAGAVALLRRAQRLSPDNLSFSVALGEALEAAGDDAGALEQYRAVVREAPESPRSSARIDAIHAKRNNPAARVAEWSGLVQAHPEAAVPRLHLGLALEAAGDNTGAEAAYREALRLDPGRPEAKVPLGALIAAAGDPAAGLRLMDEAVAALPDLAGPAAEACDRAAGARLAAGDTAGAVALLRRAHALSPTDLRWRVALGGALEAAGDDAGALEEYRAVVAQVPESPRSGERIDSIYRRRNDSAGRVAEWRGVVEKHPDAAVPQLHLGLALEAAGDAAGAEAAYRAALSRTLALEADSALFKRVRGEMAAAGNAGGGMP